MFKIGKNLERFRNAGTDSVHDAVPLVPRRRAYFAGQPSEEVWWQSPRVFGTDYRTALATDVLDTTSKWFIVSNAAAQRLTAFGPPEATPVRLVPYDFDKSRQLSDETSGGFVALDVPIVSDIIDRVRSGQKDTVFLSDPTELPPFFRLSTFDRDVYVSDASADTFRSCRGVSLRAATSTPRFANCTDLMLRVRDGNTVDAAPTEEELAATDAHGFTALHHAVEVGNVQAARALIEAGSNIDALSAQSVSPASIAAYVGSLDCIELLLSRGADMTVGKWTPGHWAAFAGHADACLRVLRIDAIKTEPTPLQLAIREGHDALALQLAAFEGLPESQLFDGLNDAMIRRRGPVALALLSRVSLPNDPAAQSKLLHAAAWSRLAELAEAVLARGVGVDTVDMYGATPLKEVVELAVRINHSLKTPEVLPMVELLMRHGADPTRRATKGLQRSAIEAVDAGFIDAQEDPYTTEQELRDLQSLADLLKRS